MSRLAPPAGCVLVAFVSQRSAEDEGYAAMAERMLALAREQPGFLGVESVRGEDGLGITLSYWTDQAAAAAWGAHPEHRDAQRLGHQRWYLWHATRIALVLPRCPGRAGRTAEGVTPP
ncbi:MAG: antibiotic biosynthesis monooxygenase [Pseudomonas oryzihabitans]